MSRSWVVRLRRGGVDRRSGIAWRIAARLDMTPWELWGSGAWNSILPIVGAWTWYAGKRPRKRAPRPPHPYPGRPRPTQRKTSR